MLHAPFKAVVQFLFCFTFFFAIKIHLVFSEVGGKKVLVHGGFSFYGETAAQRPVFIKSQDFYDHFKGGLFFAFLTPAFIEAEVNVIGILYLLKGSELAVFYSLFYLTVREEKLHKDIWN